MTSGGKNVCGGRANTNKKAAVDTAAFHINAVSDYASAMITTLTVVATSECS